MNEKKSFGFTEAGNAFFEARKATAENPEKRGSAKAILAACRMAYGDRCKIDSVGKDSLLPRLVNFLVAFNDWVDIGEKVPEQLQGHQTIKIFYEQAKKKYEEYFKTNNSNNSDTQKLKEFLDSTFAEVSNIEHELHREPKDASAEEFERIRQGRELVNGIETLMNIGVCVDHKLFAERTTVQTPSNTIADLAKKYDWLINPGYDDAALTVDEQKARMLYASTMSGQTRTDLGSLKTDKTYKIWKMTTFLTEKAGLSENEMREFMDVCEKHYANEAIKYGMSKTLIKTANTATGVPERLRELLRARLPESLYVKLVKFLQDKPDAHHQRELAEIQLEQADPKYTVK